MKQNKNGDIKKEKDFQKHLLIVKSTEQSFWFI